VVGGDRGKTINYEQWTINKTQKAEGRREEMGGRNQKMMNDGRGKREEEEGRR
jgi:hypothetical protein